MSWGPGLYLRKHFGGVTSVYLSVGRGDDQPLMINPGLSQRMRPPLYEGLGYSVFPVCPPVPPTRSWGPWLTPGSQADAAPAPASVYPAPVSPVPAPEAESTQGTGTLPAVSPQTREALGTQPGGLMLRGPTGAVAPLCQVAQNDPPSLEPAAGRGLPTCSRCFIKL